MDAGGRDGLVPGGVADRAGVTLDAVLGAGGGCVHCAVVPAVVPGGLDLLGGGGAADAAGVGHGAAGPAGRRLRHLAVVVGVDKVAFLVAGHAQVLQGVVVVVDDGPGELHHAGHKAARQVQHGGFVIGVAGEGVEGSVGAAVVARGQGNGALGIVGGVIVVVELHEAVIGRGGIAGDLPRHLVAEIVVVGSVKDDGHMDVLGAFHVADDEIEIAIVVAADFEAIVPGLVLAAVAALLGNAFQVGLYVLGGCRVDRQGDDAEHQDQRQSQRENPCFHRFRSFLLFLWEVFWGEPMPSLL